MITVRKCSHTDIPNIIIHTQLNHTNTIFIQAQLHHTNTKATPTQLNHTNTIATPTQLNHTHTVVIRTQQNHPNTLVLSAVAVITVRKCSYTDIPNIIIHTQLNHAHIIFIQAHLHHTMCHNTTATPTQLNPTNTIVIQTQLNDPNTIATPTQLNHTSTKVIQTQLSHTNMHVFTAKSENVQNMLARKEAVPKRAAAVDFASAAPAAASAKHMSRGGVKVCLGLGCGGLGFGVEVAMRHISRSHHTHVAWWCQGVLCV